MTEQQRMAEAVKRIALGYILIHLNFNLGTVNILPDWAGYLLMFSALPVLGEKEPSSLLLRPFGVLLVVWEGLVWLSTVFGVNFDVYVAEVIVTSISLYFHFQLLTNLSDIAEQYTCPEEKNIRILRTVHTILMTILTLPFEWEKHTAVMMIALAAGIVIVVGICSVLFGFHRFLTTDQENRDII